MPRVKQNPQEKLLTFLKSSAVTDEDFAEIKELESKILQEKLTADEKALEAEAVLLYFHTKGKDFVKQICAICDRPFAYKYYIPTIRPNCSNECRRIALERIGIIWTPNKSPEERWGMSGVSHGIMPLIISSSAYEVVESVLQESLADNSSPVV